MQVFTPYFKIKDNIECLDVKRRNKQILEIIQIILANNNIRDIWKIPKSVYNHPNTILWKNKEYYLLHYLNSLLSDFWNRTQKRHKCDRFADMLCKRIFRIEYYQIAKDFYYSSPKFLNLIPDHLTVEFCKNHQQILLQKNHEHYSKYFGDTKA